MADLYVKPGGADGASGTNWAEALATITRALSLAQEGTRIHLAAGTYSTNSLEVFPLKLEKSGLQVLGQGSTATVINAAGSSKNVLVVNGIGGDSRVEGVTITGGYATNELAFDEYGYGGGLNIRNSTLVLADCRITNNWAVCNAASKMTLGGGFYAGNSAVTVSHCLIKDNRAYAPATWSYSRGGGIAVAGDGLLLRNSVVANNEARGVDTYSPSAYGGGLYLNGGTHQARNCLFVGNDCTHVTLRAGQGVYVEAGTIAFENCTIATNLGEGVNRVSGTVQLRNSIAWANGDDLVNFATNAAGALTNVFYSCIEDGDNNGTNDCVTADPLFVDATYFHVSSKGGHYVGGYFDGGTWGVGLAINPLIDAGDPGSEYDLEPAPNGRRINLGAYGNTPTASKTYLQSPGILLQVF